MSKNEPTKLESAPAAQPTAPVQVQYVVSEQSLEGIGGWLIFWLIVFGLYSVSFLFWFFICLAGVAEGGLPGGTAGAFVVETMIFGLLICVSYILTVIFISMRKKLGRLMAFISLGLTALYVIVMCITGMTVQNCVRSYGYYGYSSGEVCSNVSAGVVIMLIGVIIGALIYATLVSLYFIMSRCVKMTLTK
jgi:hypothetical protein